MQVCVPLPPWAMRAGARDTIYYNPAEVNVAIVTCGGLCPGLNDVVLGLVNKLSDYGVPEGHILGIRCGLARGFRHGNQCWFCAPSHRMVAGHPTTPLRSGTQDINFRDRLGHFMISLWCPVQGSRTEVTQFLQRLLYGLLSRPSARSAGMGIRVSMTRRRSQWC